MSRRLLADEPQTDPVVAAADVVDQQPGLAVVVGHQDVHVAVVVDVAERRAAADLRQLKRGAAARGDVLESPVAQIAEQQLSLVQRKGIVDVSQRLDRLHRAVDDERVEPAVVVDVEPGRAEAGVRAARRSEPRSRALLLEEARPVVDVEVVAFSRQVRDEQVFVAVVVEIAGVDAHAGLGSPVRAQRRAGQQARVLERAIVLVDPELVRLAVVRHVEIDPAVAVEVGRRDAERRPEIARDARRRRDVGERAVAVVVIEPARLGLEHIRRTVVGPSGRTEARHAGRRAASRGSCPRTDRASRRGRSRGTTPRRSTPDRRCGSASTRR